MTRADELAAPARSLALARSRSSRRARACGDLLILAFGQSPARVYRSLLERHLGQRLRHRAGAVQGDAAHLHRARGRARVPRRALQHRRRGAARRRRARRRGRRRLPARRARRRRRAAALRSRRGAGGGAVGARARRAQGALRRARGDRHDHAELHRARRCVQLARRAELLRAARRVHTAADRRRRAAAALAALLPAFRGSAVNFALAPRCSSPPRSHVLLPARTRRGFELRARRAAAGRRRGAGIARRPTTWSLAWRSPARWPASVGANFVLGYKGYFEDGLRLGGVGFMGIAVALLGRNHPRRRRRRRRCSSARSRRAALAINALRARRRSSTCCRRSSSSPSRPRRRPSLRRGAVA